MNKTMKNYLCALVPSLLLFLIVLSQQHGITQEEVEDTNSQINGNVVNSIYLTITNHSLSEYSDFEFEINGTIFNNSTQEIEFPTIVAALYNANNQLITMESGDETYVEKDVLQPGDNSTFNITIFGSEDEEEVDHYTLYPIGTPYSEPDVEDGVPPGDFGTIPGPILPN
jgi:hypothetical protein